MRFQSKSKDTPNHVFLWDCWPRLRTLLCLHFTKIIKAHGTASGLIWSPTVMIVCWLLLHTSGARSDLLLTLLLKCIRTCGPWRSVSAPKLSPIMARTRWPWPSRCILTITVLLRCTNTRFFDFLVWRCIFRLKVHCLFLAWGSTPLLMDYK